MVYLKSWDASFFVFFADGLWIMDYLIEAHDGVPFPTPISSSIIKSGVNGCRLVVPPSTYYLTLGYINTGQVWWSVHFSLSSLRTTPPN